MNESPVTKHGSLALVTGGAGFIGSHLVDALLGSGYRVRVVDNLSTGSLSNLRNDERLEVVYADVRDVDALQRAAVDCDLAFHLAGIVGMSLAHRAAGDSYQIADEGTVNLLRATGRIPCVLFSSSCVYGLRHAGVCREADELRESDVLAYDGGVRGYAAGKLMLEQHGHKAAQAGRRIVIVRPFNVVGPRQSAAYGMVLPRFIHQASQGSVLTVYGSGEQSRCFSDVGAFARIVATLPGHVAGSSNAPLVLNVGTDVSTSINALAHAVIGQVGHGGTLRHVPFADVYPGRHDVQCRVPCNRRFDSIVGVVDWAGVDRIIQGMLTARPAHAQRAEEQA